MAQEDYTVTADIPTLVGTLRELSLQQRTSDERILQLLGGLAK